jgi:hypothetical protein
MDEKRIRQTLQALREGFQRAKQPINGDSTRICEKDGTRSAV